MTNQRILVFLVAALAIASAVDSTITIVDTMNKSNPTVVNVTVSKSFIVTFEHDLQPNTIAPVLFGVEVFRRPQSVENLTMIPANEDNDRNASIQRFDVSEHCKNNQIVSEITSTPCTIVIYFPQENGNGTTYPLDIEFRVLGDPKIFASGPIDMDEDFYATVTKDIRQEQLSNVVNISDACYETSHRFLYKKSLNLNVRRTKGDMKSLKLLVWRCPSAAKVQIIRLNKTLEFYYGDCLQISDKVPAEVLKSSCYLTAVFENADGTTRYAIDVLNESDSRMIVAENYYKESTVYYNNSSGSDKDVVAIFKCLMVAAGVILSICICLCCRACRKAKLAAKTQADQLETPQQNPLTPYYVQPMIQIAQTPTHDANSHSHQQTAAPVYVLPQIYAPPPN